MKELFKKQKEFLTLVGILLVTIALIFSPVFLNNKVPISSNLLVFFYNPWAKETFPGWEQGIPNKPTGIDDLRILYPQGNLISSILHSGNIPFWDPYIFSGNYLLGQSDTGIFYPLFLLLLVMPQKTAWTILIMLEPLLAGIGMYLFLKVLLKDTKSAIFGACVFAFSGVVIVRMVEGITEGHALLWMPYVFYGVEAYLQRIRIRYLFITLAALMLSLFSGWFQYVFYVYSFPLVYAAFRILFGSKEKKIRRSDYLVFLPFLLLPFVTLFHILPAIRTLFDSPRGTQVESSLLSQLMPIQHVLTLLMPDFWGNPGTYTFFGHSEYKESIVSVGFIPSFFALFAIFGAWKKTSSVFSVSLP